MKRAVKSVLIGAVKAAWLAVNLFPNAALATVSLATESEKVRSRSFWFAFVVDTCVPLVPVGSAAVIAAFLPAAAIKAVGGFLPSFEAGVEDMVDSII